MPKRLVLLLTLPFFFLACSNDAELDGEASEGQPARSGGSSEWDNIRWFTSRGPAGQPGAPQVMELVARITDDGRFVNFSWDQIPWSGSGAQKIRAHFFVWNGSNWEGGMYEWIRAGGQPVKTLDNIRNGYNGLRAPAPGTRVAFAWTNENASERSNIAVTTWR